MLEDAVYQTTKFSPISHNTDFWTGCEGTSQGTLVFL